MVSVKDITLCVDMYAASMPSTSREEHGGGNTYQHIR